MRILHIVQCYHPVLGGSEWLVKNLSEQFVSRFGDDVTVFTTAARTPRSFWWPSGPLLAPGIESINGVTVRRFPFFHGLPRLRMLLAHVSRRLNLPYNDWLRTIQTGPLIPEMPEAIARSGADVLFATSFPFMHMYYALAGGRKAGIPVVLLGAIHAEDRWGYDRRMIYQAAALADAYIAHTTFERSLLIERGVDPARIYVIGGGVEVAPFQQAEGRMVRQRYGWGEEPVVAVMARQSPLKRLDIVLRAMPYVWEGMPQVRLLMAGGRTPYSPTLDRMIDELPTAQRARITVISDFPEEEKANLLAASDLLVHPSGNESFGIVLAEAWAAGKPVIGARVGAIGSLIEEGVDGLLHEYLEPQSLARAILTLLADAPLRESMGRAGRRKVLDRYTWQGVAKQVREVYEEVTGRFSNRR